MSEDKKPLTADELKVLESKAGVVGLSTVDIRRLLANNARLRRLVLDAARLLTPNSPLSGEQARRLHKELKDELDR